MIFYDFSLDLALGARFILLETRKFEVRT